MKKTMKTEEELEIYWSLKDLLYERNITRPVDFRMMLIKSGLKLSYPTCFVLMHEQPVMVPMRTILGLVKMLNCSVSDLLVVRKATGQPTTTPVPPKREKVVPLTPRDKKLTGGQLKF